MWWGKQFWDWGKREIGKIIDLEIRNLVEDD
jgi:hypothetical protein